MDRNTVATPGSQPPAAPTSPLPDSPIVAPAGVQPFPDPIEGVLTHKGFAILGGLPRVGKTTLVVQWIQAWRRGEPIFGHVTHAPTEIYYVALDRPWRQYEPFFAAVGLSDLPHYAVVDDHSFHIERFLNPLSAFSFILDRLKPAPGSLIIPDPLAPLLIRGNPNNSKDVAMSIYALRRAADPFDVSLLGPVHFHKPREQDGTERNIDRIAGSGAFSGYTDCQMYLMHQQPGEEHQVFGWNPPHAAPEEFKLLRGSEGWFQPYTTDDLTKQLTGRNEQSQLLYDLIPDGIPVKTKDLETVAISTLQISKATLYRLLKLLEDAGFITRVHGLVERRKTH